LADERVDRSVAVGAEGDKLAVARYCGVGLGARKIREAGELGVGQGIVERAGRAA